MKHLWEHYDNDYALIYHRRLNFLKIVFPIN